MKRLLSLMAITITCQIANAETLVCYLGLNESDSKKICKQFSSKYEIMRYERDGTKIDVTVYDGNTDVATVESRILNDYYGLVAVSKSTLLTKDVRNNSELYTVSSDYSYKINLSCKILQPKQPGTIGCDFQN